MFFLHSETHENMCVLVPSISIGTHSCQCCREVQYYLTFDFLIWSVGIGYARH
jgi:hypothetical protein